MVLFSQTDVATMITNPHHLCPLEVISKLGIDDVVLAVIEMNLCPGMEVTFIMTGESRDWIISVTSSDISAITYQSIEEVDKISISGSRTTISVELNIQAHLKLVNGIVHSLSCTKTMACNDNFSIRILLHKSLHVSIDLSGDGGIGEVEALGNIAISAAVYFISSQVLEAIFNKVLDVA